MRASLQLETGLQLAGSKVIDRDFGWKSIKRQLAVLDNSYTKSGIQQGTLHKGDSEDSEITEMVTIAAVQEYGSPKKNIPSRPAFRNAFDNNKKKIENFTERTYNQVLNLRWGISARNALFILGEFMTKLQKRSITKIDSPPNAAATIKAKGSSNPLIHHGQLRKNVTHKEVIR